MSIRSDCANSALACGDLERSGHRAAAENEKPGLAFRLQGPGGVGGKIDPFEYEVWVGHEELAFSGKLARPHLKVSRSGVGHDDGIFDVKFTLPAGIEQPECRVAALLKFGNDEPGADRVNSAGGHENDVARRHRMPHDQIGDRAVVDGLAQLLRRQASTEAEGNLGVRRGAQNVPGFGLCRLAGPSNARTYRQDEPGWKAAGS